MKLTHPAVVALGFTTITLLGMFIGLVSPTHIEIYHLSGSATAVFIPVLLNMCALWLLLTALLFFAEHPGWPHRIIWSALILVLPWILLKSASRATVWSPSHRLSLFVFTTGLFLFILLHLFWKPSFQSWLERTQRFVAAILAITSFCGIFVFAQLGRFGWQARALNEPLPLHQRLASDFSHHPRIIWILLDELSYNQVYEQRYPGLQLPAFDRLASESTLFTHVVPAEAFTERVIPSLFTGLRIDGIRSSADGRQLTLHNPDYGSSQQFNPYDTVFQDALNARYSTGIAGWFNPYCRILNQVLDHCFWTSRLPLTGNMSDSQTLTANLTMPLHTMIDSALMFFSLRRVDRTYDRYASALHVADYQDLAVATDKLLADTSANFVFLHIPVPHPPSIYDRQHSTLTTGHSSYVDNLALADAYLTHVRNLLEQQDQWDSSIVIVMGDHSWRTRVWSKDPAWTSEDQAASHGAQFDDRPAYIVKLPHQQRPARIDVSFHATRTRALFDAIFAQRIHSSDDLSNWAGQ